MTGNRARRAVAVEKIPLPFDKWEVMGRQTVESVGTTVCNAKKAGVKQQGKEKVLGLSPDQIRTAVYYKTLIRSKCTNFRDDSCSKY
ncbi:MAG: hypothetical protein KGH98_04650 [Candidatus Micrarchaeota archaeon]|nr:hypothetical protein [Candidatus Micrarchaeota archaeon]